MTSASKLLGGAAGTAAGGALNVEDVFSTHLYNGTGAAQTITNGIDLAGEGGMVWFKNRTLAEDPMIVDTIRGGTADIYPNEANAVDVDGNVSSFNSNGFTFAGNGRQNANTYSYVSWAFRKAPKFFDIQTWTQGAGEYVLNHSLGSVPGMVLLKRTDASQDWHVYHRGMDATEPQDYGMRLNNNSARSDGSLLWNDTAPTSTTFTVGNHHGAGTYVAYLFADNSSEDAENRLISCGSYSGNESTYPTIALGFQPQWILVKSITNTRNWAIFDTMRGLPVGGGDEYLRANTNGVETTNDNQHFNINATGFSPSSIETLVNGNGETYIYMAIRAPMMAEVTDATKVFAIDQENSSAPYYTSNFPVDMGFVSRVDNSSSKYIYSRLTQTRELVMNTNAQEGGASNAQFDYMTGFLSGAFASDVYAWMWKRAKGFFDVVCYTGNDTVRTIAHGLGVVPEMIWIKTRSTANAWWVYYGDNTDYLVLNTDAATVDSNYPWQDTSPTSSVFTVGDIANVNENGATIIAYLFATLAGVSKIGTVTHSGSSTDVACGFSAGARFVMLKRTDATGDWFIWNSTSGIVSGDDPYLLMNSTAAQVTNTDYIDPYSAGFTITSSFPAGTYLYYAIA